MGISFDVKRNLPPGLELLPGETVEKLEKSSSITLFEATVDGGFTECCGNIGGDIYNLMDVTNETVVLITNYRIYYQLLKSTSKSLSSSSLSSLADTIHPRAIQIPHLSISQIDESQNQITITLKFSPLKYLFKFSKPKPNYTSNHNRSSNSLCHDFSFLLKKLVNPNSIENVFAFRMGENEINNKRGKEKEENNGKKRRELSEAEKIYRELYDTNTSEEDDDDYAIRGLDENKYKRVQKLGWSKGYKIQKEFERMQMSKDSWSIVSYNEDFTLSPTYPKDFILPSRILKKDATFACESFDTSDDSYEISTAFQSSSEFFRKLVNFRKNGRFPLICWKKGHHVLLRSGQPMVSILGWRGVEDELLIKDVLKAINEEQQQLINTYNYHKNINGYSKKKVGLQEKCINTKICILDARSYSAALGNGFARGGYENCENYPPNTTLHFLGLPNIHAISSSHSSLLSAIATYSSSPKWFSVLESTGWLSHVADLLKAAGGKDGVVGKIVEEDASVLVHCTDGWDRTTQLVSLAQIMLDPFYRTIKGFQVLIEKEWIAYGHPFRARSELPKYLRNNNSIIPPTGEDHSSSRSNCQQPIIVPPAPAPVFLLFLTCVHHLLQQFPHAFEYNDFFLLCLARAAAGNSPYGDFLCNSECEREYVQLRERTKSIWTWVREHKPWFRNTRYQQKSRTYDQYNNNVLFDNKWKKDVLKPNTGARLITLWTEYYFPKDDFSVTLLSTPPGCEIPFHTGLVSSFRSDHLSEFVLIKLLMERKEKRIAEKFWKAWRSFVLEKKSKSTINKKYDDDIIVKNGENDEIDIELIGSSVLKDDNDLLQKKTNVDKWTKEKNNVKNNSESKFLLIMPENPSLNNHQNYSNLSSPTNSSTNSSSIYVASSELLPTKEDYFSEEEQLKPVYPVNEDPSSSSQQQWVYLPSHHQKIDDDPKDLLAELLKEAQSDDHYLCQSRCHDSNVIVDLLKEAQFDNNSLLSTSRTRQRTNVSTNTTPQRITRTSSTSPSRSCRSSIICTNNFTDSNHCNSNEINSIENSSPDLDFVLV
ncbi:protein-tyrosine phosphatase-like protein [Glomus cerebriforme]|uniref:Protein-tyrosine phosphatase-like protein n=1 Tax=Glomus cerebriforme TaxID=658196 RepID=A0A397TEV0_9GLOM|nr:protein-tyrosine phosphatase-like protein [Glomus cerebriforme]